MGSQKSYCCIVFRKYEEKTSCLSYIWAALAGLVGSAAVFVMFLTYLYTPLLYYGIATYGGLIFLYILWGLSCLHSVPVNASVGISFVNLVVFVIALAINIGTHNDPPDNAVQIINISMLHMVAFAGGSLVCWIITAYHSYDTDLWCFAVIGLFHFATMDGFIAMNYNQFPFYITVIIILAFISVMSFAIAGWKLSTEKLDHSDYAIMFTISLTLYLVASAIGKSVVFSQIFYKVSYTSFAFIYYGVSILILGLIYLVFVCFGIKQCCKDWLIPCCVNLKKKWSEARRETIAEIAGYEGLSPEERGTVVSYQGDYLIQ